MDVEELGLSDTSLLQRGLRRLLTIVQSRDRGVTDNFAVRTAKVLASQSLNPETVSNLFNRFAPAPIQSTAVRTSFWRSSAIPS